MRLGVLKEAAVVGGSLVAVTGAMMLLARLLGVERRVPLPVWIFGAGAATHLAWEATGGNAYFVREYEKQVGPFAALKGVR